MPIDHNMNPRVLRLRSLQAAIDEDWHSVKDNAGTVSAILNEDVSQITLAAAIATYLLRIYSGIEQILQRIALELNGGPPQGSAWHRELLDMMARPVPSVRPAVLTRELKDQLDDYRRFRHRMTHAYGVALVWDKMYPLVEQLPRTMSNVEQCMERFRRFIDELCDAV